MVTTSNIMLIDDDEIFTYIIKKIIDETKLADQINIFGNGREAITYLEKVANEVDALPEVIFLDLNMPSLFLKACLCCIDSYPGSKSS